MRCDSEAALGGQDAAALGERRRLGCHVGDAHADDVGHSSVLRGVDGEKPVIGQLPRARDPEVVGDPEAVEPAVAVAPDRLRGAQAAVGSVGVAVKAGFDAITAPA